MIIRTQVEVAAETACHVYNTICQMGSLRAQATRERGALVRFSEIATLMERSTTLPGGFEFDLADLLDKVRHTAVKEWLAQQAASDLLE